MLLLAPGASGQSLPLPQISLVIIGTLGANGWYISNVTVNWQITVPDGGPDHEDCKSAETLTGDTPGTDITCQRELRAGSTITARPSTVKLDKTAPGRQRTVLERQADANGWYNRPLTVAFTGTDATSQIATLHVGAVRGPGQRGGARSPAPAPTTPAT